MLGYAGGSPSWAPLSLSVVKWRLRSNFKNMPEGAEKQRCCSLDRSKHKNWWVGVDGWLEKWDRCFMKCWFVFWQVAWYNYMPRTCLQVAQKKLNIYIYIFYVIWFIKSFSDNRALFLKRKEIKNHNPWNIYSLHLSTFIKIMFGVNDKESDTEERRK